MPDWLVKTDPALFAWDDLVRAGLVAWNGVTNALAQRHLRAMRQGDRVLVYHGGRERSVVGLARVAGPPYAEVGTVEGHDVAVDVYTVAVDLAPQAALARPVPRRVLAARADLRHWELVRCPRLTVLPVPPAAWRVVLALGGAGDPGRRRKV